MLISIFLKSFLKRKNQIKNGIYPIKERTKHPFGCVDLPVAPSFKRDIGMEHKKKVEPILNGNLFTYILIKK